jgi:hypothetical protein
MANRWVQKYPQTSIQEYLAGNSLDGCRSGRQIPWSKDWFRNTRRLDRSTWLVTILIAAGQVGRSHGQKIGSEIPPDQTGVPGW